jgi:hypothetical protein
LETPAASKAYQNVDTQGRSAAGQIFLPARFRRADSATQASRAVLEVLDAPWIFDN